MPTEPDVVDVARPRSLADDLRARSDDELASLLRLRPDLAHPLPSDLGQLAVRSATGASTARALDRLDQFQLQVLDAGAAVDEPFTDDDVVALLPGVAEARTAQALATLHTLALVWGGAGQRRVASVARQALGTHPAGLGPGLTALLPGLGLERLTALLSAHDLPPASSPPRAATAIAQHLARPDVLDPLLAQAPDDAVAVLERLTWGPPHGSVGRADRLVTPDTAASPIEWLLARGLLVAADPETVVLPREIALQLRGGAAHQAPAPDPPTPQTRQHEPDLVDRSAAGAAFDTVRRVEDLLEAWSVDPPSVLRSGGLGVRELKSAATALDVDEATAGLYVEVAHAAGLLAASGDVDDVWLPTPAYDVWHTRSAAERWAALVEAWLETTRAPGLIGSRDGKGGRLNALSPALDRVVGPEIRLALLRDLADQPAGQGLTTASLADRQAWRAPRRGGRLRAELVGWSLTEAACLGLTGLGVLARYARPLLADRPDLGAAATTLKPWLPTPVDHVLLQADLTAVAPGPLDGDVARELALMADVESTGGATVYRFTESSVRRALDAGRSASELHQLLATHSRTPVPQPLSYLVDDVARRHGRLRVGAASSYLRCDDPSALDEVIADRRAASLRLRRLAPTVAVAQSDPATVLDALRRMGAAPAAESGDGALLVRRPDARRTPPRGRPPRLLADAPAPSPTIAEAAVRAMRSGDRGAAGMGGTGSVVAGPAGSGELPRTAVADTLTALRDAVEAGRAVWIGYVGNDGTVSERALDPVTVHGGWLTAYDHRFEEVRTFAVHRITGVAPLDPSSV